ncbi:hypothetical protein FACS1894179_10070 [Bacteroidia bacterium]|nr:hypothetical protein FACS1894179_10070 [Bacteroidia bacterium]
MRLRDLKRELDEYIPLLNMDVESINRGNGVVAYKLKNVKDLQKAVSGIGKLNLFDERINTIKKYPLYTHSENSIIFSEAEYKPLTATIKSLLEECTNLSNALGGLITKENPNLVSIKIPDPKDFLDLGDTITKLNTIFSQTLYANEIKGDVKIANFDSGSYWIDIIVTGASVVNIIAGLAWSGVIVYKKLQEGRLVQAQVKQMNISNKALEEIIEKSKDAVNGVAEIEASFLYNTFFKGDDNEQIGRIKHALKELAELYSQGAEIHPAINASSEIKKEFPDYKKIDRVETKIQKIESKKK